MSIARGILVVVVACGLVPSFAVAQEMNFIGSDKKAMGGTGVAGTSDATATYWNPSRLLSEGGLDIRLSFGLGAGVEGDVISKADNVKDTIDSINFDALKLDINSGNPMTNTEVQQLLDLALNDIPALAEEGEGIFANLDGGLFVRLPKITDSSAIGIHVRGQVYAGAEAIFDFTNISLSTDVNATTQVDNLVGAGADRSAAFTNASSQALANSVAAVFTAAGIAGAQNRAEELVYQAERAGVNTGDPMVQDLVGDLSTAVSTVGATTFSNNNSGVLVRGILMKEVGLSYAHTLVGETLNIGATLRVIEGETYIQYYPFDALEDGEEFVDEVRDRNNTKTSVKFAGDIGATLNLPAGFSAGAVIKNLGSPQFDFKDPGARYPVARGVEDFELDPVYRIGLAWKPIGLLTLAADADLNKVNSGVLEGYESQFVNAGAELSLGFLKLRGGLYENTASKDPAPVATAGIGLKIFMLELDLAGGMSLKKEDISVGADDEEIPTSASFSATLGLKF